MSRPGERALLPRRQRPHKPRKPTHVKDLPEPWDDAVNSEEGFSEDDVDPEAREQAFTEQSGSDDKMLASMEARGDTDALGAGLAADVVC